MVNSLYGNGVNPAVNTIQKSYSSYNDFTSKKLSSLNTWAKNQFAKNSNQ